MLYWKWAESFARWERWMQHGSEHRWAGEYPVSVEDAKSSATKYSGEKANKHLMKDFSSLVSSWRIDLWYMSAIQWRSIGRCIKIWCESSHISSWNKLELQGVEEHGFRVRGARCTSFLPFLASTASASIKKPLLNCLAGFLFLNWLRLFNGL